ncbi:MAG: hypothetical protein KGL12_11380 [Rhodospirillales bacterium]|nr:hypothetical protein [Rhodospirillales bacterium]
MNEAEPRRSLRRGLVRLAAGLAAMPVLGRSAKADDAKASPAGANPFASHHLVLQLSDDTPEKRALVLSVAYNMLNVYTPDGIAIEVVAFAEGIALLRAEAPERVRVDSLVAQGVRFDVCMNTIQTIERKTGKPVALNPKAHPVPAGVATILNLVEHGYTLVRP